MKFYWFLVCLASPVLSIAQSAAPANKAAEHAIALYAKRVKGESLLYNGLDYVRYIPLKDEHPYFLSDDWLQGTIMYDGQRYDSVWFFYNTFTDNVIIENYNFSSSIQLIKERIQFFATEGHTFILVNHPSLAPGFYELVYDGETRVLVKHIKQFNESIQSGELVQKFLEKRRYYIRKNNIYYQVGSKGSVLKVLKENKKEINHEFRKMNINFSTDPVYSIATMARINDQLK